MSLPARACFASTPLLHCGLPPGVSAAIRRSPFSTAASAHAAK